MEQKKLQNQEGGTVEDNPSRHNSREDFVRFIQSEDFSVRATNVLLQNCFSLDDFTSLTKEKLLSFKNCGRKTVREILNFLPVNRAGGMLMPPLPPEDQLVVLPPESSIELLPLFSSQRFRGITGADLHPGFQASTKLSDLIISYRTSSILEFLGLETIGEVMLTPGDELLHTKNFGRKSLRELRDIVRSLCLDNGQGGEQDAVDYSSYDAMVEYFVSQCVKSKRNQQLFKKRFCFTGGKAPTLEELGQQFGISRERARQILKKGFDKLRIKANLDRLHSFWQKLDDLVLQGGGMVKLDTLSRVLQAHYKWVSAPYPLALGQFLLLKEAHAVFKQADDLLEIPSPCQSCRVPHVQLQMFDFESTESFHIQVVAARLSQHCQQECPEGKPVVTFYPAFIERLVENSDGLLILHNDVVLLYKRWREKYCNNLEDVVCKVLESNGEPMHFREIACCIRHANENFRDISDHNVHAAIMRYDSIEIINRGTYGLKSWGLGGYRSVSTAVEELIDEKGLPQKRQDIINALQGEFSEQNITASLKVDTRFTSIGEGFYDRQQNWQERTCQGLVKLLPEPVADFANYLVSRNNTSYKLVMAFNFIRSMDEDGSIYLNKLKDMFYNFYRYRHKKGLVVELDSSVMSRIAELSPANIKSKAIKEPLKSFLHSGFAREFSQNGVKLKLAKPLMSELYHGTTRNTLLITILKAIDDYFRMISPAKPVVPTASRQPHFDDPRQEVQQAKPAVEPGQHSPSIVIKKKRRGKIKL